MSTKLLTTTVLGSPIPPLTPHAISVCLPTWKDNVGYKEGEKRVVDSLVTGYPRLFIHQSIKKVRDPPAARSPSPSAPNVVSRSRISLIFLQLADICEQRFGVNGEGCLLFPAPTAANHCRAFVIQEAAKDDVDISVRITQFNIHPSDEGRKFGAELHIVLFPADKVQYVQPFWRHTGLGISSRYAERFLSLLHKETDYVKEPKALPIAPDETRNEDCSTSLEEGWGQSLSQDAITFAKRTLRRRIAGASLRDGPAVMEDDVYLYPTGMTAIWDAHQMISAMRPAAKSVGFGFVFN